MSLFQAFFHGEAIAGEKGDLLISGGL